jgi:acetyltransferase-like isoleucine patch superfamily enzyme
MRREFAEFNRLYPSDSSKKGIRYRLVLSIRKHWWKRKLSHIKAGSEIWHKYQQKISLLSTAEDDMEIRNYFYERSITCGGKAYILPNVIFCYPYRIKLGYNVFINRGTYITARGPVTIGDHVIIGPGVIINSGMHQYMERNTLIRDQGHRISPIHIGNDVWIGANAVIMPGVTLGDGCVIGAGAIVTHSIPAYTVAVGVAAKVIKERPPHSKCPLCDTEQTILSEVSCYD